MRTFAPCIVFVLLYSAALRPAADNRVVAEAAFDELVRQDFGSLAKRFTPEMNAAGVAEKLPGLIRSLGALRSARPQPRVTQAQGYDVFIFPSEFQNARLNVVITLNAQGQLAGLFRPPDPEPAKPGELVVASGEIKLPATLTRPEGSSPFPVVVLVHGSGPHDRDETVGANAPFRDLAEGLAQRGIASLRYVKRTKQYPQSPVVTVKEEVIDDAVSALALVRRQPGIDAKHVYILGHSLGGYVAPRIAAADPAVAGIILLAANVRPIEELAREQLRYLSAPPEALEQLMRMAPPSYWADLKAYDPVASARKFGGPILILQGERDYQVTMQDYELWQTGLKGRKNVTFKSYPKLNHLFLEGEGKSLPAEYSKPGHIPGYVLDDIAAFISRSGSR